MKTMAAMMTHRHWRERPPLDIETFQVDRDRVSRALQKVRDEGRVTMGEVEARTRAERLKNGVPLPDDVWATIVAAARSVGINDTAIADASR